MVNGKCIVAPATPAGGAIGMVRVSGPDAVGVVSSVFSKDITQAEGYTCHYGTINDSSHQAIDDVVVNIYRAPHSYTGEDSVEIMCHGSAFIIQSIVSLLCSQGCTLAQPGEFTKLAFLAGKMDLSQAEAVADLISSSNAATHRLAISQMRGGFSNELRRLRERLLHITSLLELEIDFSEEDVEFADRQQLLSLTQEVETVISRLLGSFRAGNAIKNGIPVVIAGETNVGKSTLLNQLLGEERALVSDIKGTTRDTIEELVSIDGYTFRFIDTAGIRQTDDTIESMGIERTLQKLRDAQIIILMKEPGVDYPVIDISDSQHVIRIENKTPQFQAINGLGLDALKAELTDIASSLCQTDSDIVVTNLRHVEALRQALEAIQRVNGSTSDLIALNIRDCIHHLAEITGDITSDDTLHNIFRHFCIGK